MHAGAGIGIADFPQDSESMSDQMYAADDAMYRARQAGNACCYYSPGIPAESSSG